MFDVYQSGFRVNHSTKIALIRVVNDVKISTDNHEVSILVLLDLSAAFDTVDHEILDVSYLSQILKSWFMLLFPVEWTTAMLFLLD